jgi:hypothetical protein
MLLCSIESLSYNVPVDDLPDGLDVVRADVAIVNIVCVLPDTVAVAEGEKETNKQESSVRL